MEELSVTLMADLLKWPEEKVRKALEFYGQYRTFRKKKRNGGFRTIHAPHPILKEFQRRLLKYFLYRIGVRDWNVTQGCRPKFSSVTNAKAHLHRNMHYVLRLDLKDAFPSVKKEFFTAILRNIFARDIAAYEEGYHFFPPLFSKKRVRWFRDLFGKRFGKHKQPSLFYHACVPQKIVADFIGLLMSFTTHKGRLPQGAPTSPHLLNLAVSQSGLIGTIHSYLKDNEIIVIDNTTGHVSLTVYVDDFTISSSRPIPKRAIYSLIQLIEEKFPFRINREKTLYYNGDRIAPMVTGLRLVRLKKTRQDLERVLLGDSSLTYQQKDRILKRSLNESGEWITEAVRLPKKQIRKIRGLIYRACLPEYREKLKNQVEGYIAYMKAVYGDELPRQVAIPWKKYQSLKN